jgi:hypothetical protein
MVVVIMTSIETTSEIIDALGGNASVARLTSSTAKAVSNWRGFGKFPSNTFLIIKAELMRHGMSAPDHLWSMREPPVAKKRRPVSA